MLSRPLLIATAGHVDHGKSTFIKILTGTDPDRLPEEKLRGITLDLGFAFAPGVSFIDCPGHDGLIRHMVTGHQAVDGVCLIVALNEGVCEQTLEHVRVINWLGIKNVLVVFTKSDLVDQNSLTERTQELLKELKENFAPQIIWTHLHFEKDGDPEIALEILRTFFTQVRSPGTYSFDRFFIDRAFVVKGTGTVVTGTFYEGRAFKNMTACLWRPSNKRTKIVNIKSIRSQNETLAVQSELRRTAFAIDNAGASEIMRGSVLILQEELPTLSQSALLGLEFLGPIKKQQTLVAQIGSISVQAKLRLHPLGFWRCHFEFPIPVRRHDRIILRQPHRTPGVGHCIAGGIILDAFAPNKKIELPPPVEDDQYIDWVKQIGTKDQLKSLDFWTSKLGWSKQKVSENLSISKFLAAPEKAAERNFLERGHDPLAPQDEALLEFVKAAGWQAVVEKKDLDRAHKLVQKKLLYRVRDLHFLHHEFHQQLVGWLDQHFSQVPDLTIEQARGYFQTGRKNFLEILEYCDRHQFTFRKDLVRKRFRIPKPLDPGASRPTNEHASGTQLAPHFSPN